MSTYRLLFASFRCAFRPELPAAHHRLLPATQTRPARATTQIWDLDRGLLTQPADAQAGLCLTATDALQVQDAPALLMLACNATDPATAANQTWEVTENGQLVLAADGRSVNRWCRRESVVACCFCSSGSRGICFAGPFACWLSDAVVASAGRRRRLGWVVDPHLVVRPCVCVRVCVCVRACVGVYVRGCVCLLRGRRAQLR
jgi:hypothetical protein